MKNYQINKKRGNSKQSQGNSKNQSIHYKPCKGDGAVIDSNNSLEVPMNPGDTMIINNKAFLNSNHKLNLTNLDNSVFEQRVHMQSSLKNMHKNVNNSVVIESNPSIGSKVPKTTAIQSGTANIAKVGNLIGGFTSNSSQMNNLDKTFTDKIPKQFAQHQINFNRYENNNSSIPIKQNNPSILVNQKQRPHSSFKASTQKQINTNSFKHPLAQQDTQGSILIGAGGVVGINGLNLSGQNNKAMQKHQNKNLSHQVKNKYGISGSTTQQINQLSVYTNELVQDAHNDGRQKESKRGQRISNSVISSDLGVMTKEQRELRTSSATAGNTGTEYKLLNMTTGGFNPNNNNFGFVNPNQNFAPGAAKSSAQAAASKLSVMSGHNSASNSMMGFNNKIGAQAK